MTPTEFTRAVSLTRIRPESAGALAARAVLVTGLTQYQAAKYHGCSDARVWQAIRRIVAAAAMTECPTCGHCLTEPAHTPSP